MENHGYSLAIATHDEASDTESIVPGGVGRWTPSAAPVPVNARVVFLGGDNEREGTMPTPPAEQYSPAMEYYLPLCARLAALLGFLLVGAAGVALAFGAFMLQLAFVLPGMTYLDDVAMIGFILACLGFAAGLFFLASTMLSAATSGVLVVWWRCGGRVPCPSGLGLGDLFSSFRQ